MKAGRRLGADVVIREAAALASLAGDGSGEVRGGGSEFRRNLRNQLQAGMQAGFAAAKRDRTMEGWPLSSASMDQLLGASGGVLNARSREAMRNNGYAEAVALAYRRSMSRLTPRASARDPQTGKLLEGFNKAANVLWRRWSSRPQLCDLEGRRTFNEMQGLAGEEFASVGRALVVWSWRQRAGVSGLTLQMIEPEQLALELESWQGREVRDGVEIDVYGRAVAYHLHRRGHPYEDARSRSVRVPASRVIDLMRQRRVRQTSGLGVLTPELVGLWQRQKVDQATLMAMWMEQCVGLIDEEVEDADDGLGAHEEGDPEGWGTHAADAEAARRPEVTFQPGMIAKGKFKEFNPKRPHSTYMEFMDQKMHALAAATGLDVATVSKNYNGSYSSRRQGQAVEYQHVDGLQELQVSTGLGQRVWELWLRFEVIEGRLPLTLEAYAKDPYMYSEAKWAPPPRPAIDEAKSAAYRKIMLDYRLKSRGYFANLDGEDAGETLEEIAELQRLADALGVPLPEDVAMSGGGRPGASASESRPVRGMESAPESEDGDAEGMGWMGGRGVVRRGGELDTSEALLALAGAWDDADEGGAER